MSANNTGSARAERIADDLRQMLAPQQLIVEDVTVIPAGNRRLVRVLVDRALPETAGATTAATAPLDLDALADATRLVSDRLDETDAMGEQAYVLEVSSPGTDRPLTLPRHFRRNVGRLVELSAAGLPTITGRIVGADDEQIELEVAGAKGATSRETRTYDQGLRGAVQVEWNRTDATEEPSGEDE